MCESSMLEKMSFSSLGLSKQICTVVQNIGWSEPTPIQKACIPVALSGRDIVGLAEAGSGKTGAYVLPILQSLIAKPKFNYALILCPTRELVIQTVEVCKKIGDEFGLSALGLIGGQNSDSQTSVLKNSNFHIIVGTPGRIAFHFAKSKALKLSKIKFLVVDEADQMLDDTFEAELSIIIEAINSKRRTFLFSATMCDRLEKLQKICQKQKPRIIEVSQKYDKSKKLDHAFVFLPEEAKDVYVLQLIKKSGISASSHRSIVYTNTWRDAYRLMRIFNNFFANISGQENEKFASLIHGHMKQSERQESISEFKSGGTSILVATDLASRGLDLPDVDLIINYDVPVKPSWSDCVKTYVHRIGRTARASKVGRAIMLVSPYAVSHLKIIESTMEESIPQIKWTPADDDSLISRSLLTISEELKGELKDQAQEKMKMHLKRLKRSKSDRKDNINLPLKKIKI